MWYILNVNIPGISTGSGKSDYDYPALTATIPSLEMLPSVLLSSPENATAVS